MLTDFRKLIVKAIISYIKMKEGNIDHLDFSQGMNLVLFSTKSISDDIKRHALNIYLISHDIKLELFEPVECVRRVFNYMRDKIKLGFFSSNLKQLRDAMIHAIDCYDASYIKWENGNPHLEARIDKIASVSALVVNVPQPESLRLNGRSAEEEIAGLNAQIDGMMRQRKIDLAAYQQNLQDQLQGQGEKIRKQEDKISALLKQLKEVSTSLADIVEDNFALREEVERLQAQQQARPADDLTPPGSVDSEDEETKRQRFGRA